MLLSRSKVRVGTVNGLHSVANLNRVWEFVLPQERDGLLVSEDHDLPSGRDVVVVHIFELHNTVRASVDQAEGSS